jgi:hypothetical protein
MAKVVPTSDGAEVSSRSPLDEGPGTGFGAGTTTARPLSAIRILRSSGRWTTRRARGKVRTRHAPTAPIQTRGSRGGAWGM